MDHSDLISMLRAGTCGRTWAELGSGEGNFTLALADLLGPGSEIHSVDLDRRSLARQRARFEAIGRAGGMRWIEADFTRAIDVPPLDGVLLANSLHFQPDQPSVLALVKSYLKPGGRLLLVEYETDRGNPWVPHPLSFARWEELARVCGFTGTRLLASYPSRFLGSIYSALSFSG